MTAFFDEYEQELKEAMVEMFINSIQKETDFYIKGQLFEELPA